MGSLSAQSEPDAGLRYPTRVTDSNGNYITLEYLPGINQGGTNSSARISWIQDVRSAPGNTYTFNYTTFSGELVPHLTGIAASLPTGDNYTLAHTAVGLKDPFFATARGNSRFLQSLTATGPGLVHNFEYDANGTVPSGELTRVIFPYKGELQWVYGPFIYPDTQQLREVVTRKLVKQLGAAATT